MCRFSRDPSAAYPQGKHADGRKHLAEADESACHSGASGDSHRPPCSPPRSEVMTKSRVTRGLGHDFGNSGDTPSKVLAALKLPSSSMSISSSTWIALLSKSTFHKLGELGCVEAGTSSFPLHLGAWLQPLSWQWILQET